MMDVGAPTHQAETVVWIEIRQGGKFLLEYDPLHNRIRLRRWGQTFIVDLAPAGVGSVAQTAVTPTLLK